MTSVLTASPTLGRSVTATVVQSLTGLYPSSLTYPGSDVYPGRGNELSSTVFDTGIPEAIPFLIGFGYRTLTGVPI